MAITSDVQGRLTASADAVELSCGGLAGAAFEVLGTYSGTITFEGRIGSGAYTAILFAPSTTLVGASTTTSTGIFFGHVGGLTSVRARMSSYSSGNALVTARAVESSPGLAITVA